MQQLRSLRVSVSSSACNLVAIQFSRNRAETALGEREDTAIYIASMAAELAQLAAREGHPTLAYILETARYEANIASLGPTAGPLVLHDDD